MIRELQERARAVGSSVAAELEGLEEREAAQRALEAVASAGLVAYCVPERDGGARSGEYSSSDKVSVRLLCALRDELAYHSGMLDVMLTMQGLGSYPVVLGGSERLRQDVLPGVASGASIAAFALTEPNAGSSLTDVETGAERVGEGWRLSGHKTFISNCGIARFYTVLARTSGEPGSSGGLSMFFVPADLFGVECEPFEVMAPHPIGDVRFNDCELPPEFLLGEEGGGLGIALGTLSRFRTSVAAAANGFSRRALDESLGRLSSRIQFGKPLSANQALRFELADMDARLRGAQLLVDEAAELVDSDQDSTLAVARAKLVATEAAGWICDRAVQHFGGLGVKRGVMVERLYRDVRALRIYEGTSEIQKLIISKARLDSYR